MGMGLRSRWWMFSGNEHARCTAPAPQRPEDPRCHNKATADGLCKVHLRKIGKMPDEKKFYIWDCRSYVGNDILLWRPEGQGYTTDVDDAGLFDESYIRGLRETDIPIPQEMLQALTRRVVVSDSLWSVPFDENWPEKLRKKLAR